MSKSKEIQLREFNITGFVNVNQSIEFSAVDIAKAIGYKDPCKAVQKYCVDHASREVISENGSRKEFFIGLTDVVRLIDNSPLPTSEHFEQWFFEELLPFVRKNVATQNQKDQVRELRARIEHERELLVTAIGELAFKNWLAQKKISYYKDMGITLDTNHSNADAIDSV